MRTVPGRTEHIVVIGAGLGGLSAALHLAGADRQVTIIERDDAPGGRCGLLVHGDYRVDTGPSVLTMPDVIARTLAAVGETLGDWLTLRRLDPAYRAGFADGSVIDLHADLDQMADQIAAVCGPRDAVGFRRYVTWLEQLYRLEFDRFVDRNLDSVADLEIAAMARLAAIGGFRRLAPKVGSFLRDDRLRRLFSFQAMYAGVAPTRALALYGVITYLDSVQGVYFPVGGMHALPRALADVAIRHGVSIRYGTRVEHVEVSADRARAVITSSGERIACDAVVINADRSVARRELLGRGEPARRSRRVRYAPSCVLVHYTTAGRLPAPTSAHHVLSFGQAWRATFAELRRGEVMSDPSFLVSTPTVSDPGLGPAGHHLRQVLFPAPNLDHPRPVDWLSTAPRYLDHVRRVLDQRGFGLAAGASDVIAVRTPADWLAAGLHAGTPFAAAHTIAQTGPFRPSTLDRRIANLVYCGSSTQPGVGIPMVLLSGRLAALRITGAGDRRGPGTLRR